MFSRKTDNKFDDILNECLDNIAQGRESLEQCLARYPEHAAELRPLLQTAAAVRKAAAAEPSPEFRARARYQFNARLDEIAAKKRARPPAWQRNWALAASMALMLILSGGGVVTAAASSMPDSPLYSVKLATEQVQLFFTPSSEGKAELYAKLADKRVDEIINMAKDGNAALVTSTTNRLAADLSNITGISSNHSLNWGLTGPSAANPPAANTTIGSGGILAQGGETATPTTTKTVTQTIAGAMTSSATTTATTTTSAPEMLNTDKSQTTGERLNITPACSGQDNFACRFSDESLSNVNDLYAAMEGAPEDVQQALMQTIQVLVGGYNDAMNAAINSAG